MVELVPGMDIYVYKEDVSEALTAGQLSRPKNRKANYPPGPNGAAMARNLLRKFFRTKELVGASLAKQPKEGKKTLDPNIIEAIIGKYEKDSHSY